MADTTQSTPKSWKVDKAWVAILLIPVVLAIFDPVEVWPMLTFAAGAFGTTSIFIVFAVLAVAYMKATGAENLLARAFEGRELHMIAMAALMGGLSPFCSCEVIPFIAALLAVGAPLSAVMAFWLSSPLMDPAMFLITSGTLGVPFAVAKAASAVSLGLFGGLMVKTFARTAIFADPLKTAPVESCCSASSCGSGEGGPLRGETIWKFWPHADRRRTFRDTVIENALFLGKWLLLAYMIEALMLRYVPADMIARALGGDGIGPIILGALVGMPAYLNGYAAVPLVGGLLEQGMSNGAAMSFVLAGGVSSIPAAIAVWALVKPRVFSAYLGLALIGSVAAGFVWNVIA